MLLCGVMMIKAKGKAKVVKKEIAKAKVKRILPIILDIALDTFRRPTKCGSIAPIHNVQLQHGWGPLFLV